MSLIPRTSDSKKAVNLITIVLKKYRSSCFIFFDRKKVIGNSPNHKLQPMSYTLMQLNIRPKFINLIEFVTVWVHFRY